MSKTFLSFPKISASLIGMLVTGACFTVGIETASAQQGVDPLDANNERTADPFSSSRDNSDYSPFFDLMHRIQLGNIRTMSEFGQDQQQSIGSEATDFRTRQRELILQTQPNSPETLAPPSETPVPTVAP